MTVVRLVFVKGWNVTAVGGMWDRDCSADHRQRQETGWAG